MARPGNGGCALPRALITTTFATDILITSTTYWENTCKVIPPSHGDPTQPNSNARGTIFLSPGQPSLGFPKGSYMNFVLSRPLYDATDQIDFSSTTLETPLPAPYLGGHTDN